MAFRLILRLPSNLLHLRLPFSLFLLPIYLAALAAAESIDLARALATFAIIHLLLYPASQGFNSYFDRDTGPIGGIERPPPVDSSLLGLSLILDIAALAAGFILCGAIFALGILAYGTASKLYSWDRTRLKSRPVIGWLMTGFGQGGLTFCLVLATVDPRGLDAITPISLFDALSVSVLLLGVFPLTQVYQHEADATRGDLTMSRLVGVRGTFYLAGACLGIGVLSLGALVFLQSGAAWTLAFVLLETPAALYFGLWLRAVLRDPRVADYRRTMGMNLIASGLLNLFYIAYLAIGRPGTFG
jgi:1,4-dihydroxy-2-naphthoate octaprenyltransferase